MRFSGFMPLSMSFLTSSIIPLSSRCLSRFVILSRLISRLMFIPKIMCGISGNSLFGIGLYLLWVSISIALIALPAESTSVVLCIVDWFSTFSFLSIVVSSSRVFPSSSFLSLLFCGTVDRLYAFSTDSMYSPVPPHSIGCRCRDVMSLYASRKSRWYSYRL